MKYLNILKSNSSSIKLYVFFIIAMYINSVNALYFELKGDKERCYVDEFFQHSVVVIKYEIFGIDMSDEANQKLIESLQIKFIKDETGDLISRHIIRQFSGKFSLTVDEDSMYKICTHNIVSSWWGNKKVFINIKIETDTQDEIDINKVIKKEDIDPMASKINKIIKKAQKIIQKQSHETQIEDESYLFQQNYIKIFTILTIFQILVVLIIGIYHMFSFKHFLVSHKVINK